MQIEIMDRPVFGAEHEPPDCLKRRILVHPLLLIFIKALLLCSYVSADDSIVTFYSENMKKLCTFRVELAATPEEHERGLMYRKSLASDDGMLFVFETDRVQFFWMKNTYIPLDMVFINSKYEVTGIYKSAKPFDETTVTSWSPAMYVLEINSGKANQCNIKVGSKVKLKNILR